VGKTALSITAALGCRMGLAAIARALRRCISRLKNPACRYLRAGESAADLERDGANKEAPNLVDPLEKRVKRGGMPQHQMWTSCLVSDIPDTEYKVVTD
jgi:hypothetical protein